MENYRGPDYTIRYGEKYEASKSLDNAGVAKLIRQDIAAAIKSGVLPKGLKTSVTCSRGNAISLKVTGVPEGFPVLNPNARPNANQTNEVYSYEMLCALGVLTSIHNSYNYDGSDMSYDYFNVRYYGRASIGWELEAAARASSVAA